jgi:hypothetical protein
LTKALIYVKLVAPMRKDQTDYTAHQPATSALPKRPDIEECHPQPYPAPTFSCPCGVSRLCHEVLYDPVKDAAIVVTLQTQLHKVANSLKVQEAGVE